MTRVTQDPSARRGKVYDRQRTYYRAAASINDSIRTYEFRATALTPIDEWMQLAMEVDNGFGVIADRMQQCLWSRP